MPKQHFPIGAIIETTYGKGLVVGYNPPSQSTLERDRYHVYLYDINIFDYPPFSQNFKLLSGPTDQTSNEVQTRIFDLLSQPSINQFKISDIFIDHALLNNIILDNGYKTSDGDIQYHIGTYRPDDNRYFLSYIFEREITAFPQQNIQKATAVSKQRAYQIIKEHMLQPIL